MCVFVYDQIGSVVVMVGADALITTGSYLMPEMPVPPAQY
jgi:hypothetical protein